MATERRRAGSCRQRLADRRRSTPAVVGSANGETGRPRAREPGAGGVRSARHGRAGLGLVGRLVGGVDRGRPLDRVGEARRRRHRPACGGRTGRKALPCEQPGRRLRRPAAARVAGVEARRLADRLARKRRSRRPSPRWAPSDARCSTTCRSARLTRARRSGGDRVRGATAIPRATGREQLRRAAGSEPADSSRARSPSTTCCAICQSRRAPCGGRRQSGRLPTSRSSASASSSSRARRRRPAPARPSAPTLASKPVSVRSAVRTRAASAGIDRAASSLGFVRAPDRARRALGGAHRHALARRSACASLRRPSWSGTAEHRAGVALGELAALDQREHVVRQLEQPELFETVGFDLPTRSATSPSESSNSSSSTA